MDVEKYGYNINPTKSIIFLYVTFLKYTITIPAHITSKVQ